MIKLYQNVFSEKDYLKIKEFINKPSWEFGQTSTTNLNDSYPFFKMNLNNEKFFTDNIFKKIESITKLKFELLDVYANGNLFGMPGSPHVDSICDNDYTFLIYVHDEWDITWGGKTVFFDNNDFYFVYPSRDVSVFFKSNLNHFCEDLSRSFRGMRISIAYKLKNHE